MAFNPPPTSSFPTASKFPAPTFPNPGFPPPPGVSKDGPQFGSIGRPSGPLATEFPSTYAPPKQAFPTLTGQPDNSQQLNDLKQCVKNYNDRKKKREEHYSKQLR